MNGALNQSLAEISILLHSDFQSNVNDIASDAKSRIDQSLACFQEEIERRFDSNGSYETMSRALVCVENVGDLPFTSNRIPDFDELKEIASNRISSDAKKIRDMLGETVEWDGIDQLIFEFEKALVLDKFVVLDVENLLYELKQKRVGSEGFVHEKLTSMIQSQDFSSIREFLVPLAESKDIHRRDKHRQCISKIAAELKVTINQLHKDMQEPICERTIKNVLCGLEIIDSAAKEIGMYYLGNKLDIISKFEKVKTNVRSILKILLDKMHSACMEYDFQLFVLKCKESERRANMILLIAPK